MESISSPKITEDNVLSLREGVLHGAAGMGHPFGTGIRTEDNFEHALRIYVRVMCPVTCYCNTTCVFEVYHLEVLDS